MIFEKTELNRLALMTCPECGTTYFDAEASWTLLRHEKGKYPLSRPIIVWLRCPGCFDVFWHHVDELWLKTLQKKCKED